jgi:single-strand DNA-binding protein
MGTAAAGTAAAAAEAGGASPGANEVRLVGRVSADPQEQELPSGDRVVTLRLVVPRERPRPRSSGKGGPTGGASGGASVDTIDVACWSARTRTGALRLAAGDHAEVSGSLRRRFFRAGGAAVSRYEVEAASVRRVRA